MARLSFPAHPATQLTADSFIPQLFYFVNYLGSMNSTLIMKINIHKMYKVFLSIERDTVEDPYFPPRLQSDNWRHLDVAA